MRAFVSKYHRSIFYTAWFVVGLLQAAFTELQDDEAYYWVFSKYLAWGYFDHPPMVALIIRIGTTFLGGELAVRIVPLILNTATIYLTERLTDGKNPALFYAIILSVAALQVSGFVAVPDVPLLFFTALVFLVYRRFLREASWLNTLLLGVVASCLLYSKYHGALLLFFVLLSNLRLLQNSKVYAAGIVALVLFVPHLWWQYNHNWISFQYHLFESNVNPYKFSYTTDYLLGQLLIAGPIAGVLLWPAGFLYRTKNGFEKALKFVAIGFVLFFLLSTLKGKVEPNWTAPAIIPLMALAYRYGQLRVGWRRWLIRLLPVTVALVIAFRIAMVANIIPAEAMVERYHAWKGWPRELKTETEGLPVVFNNSYQRASKHWFYTGQMTYSLNKFDDRRNNYNFWPVEDSILGKAVYVMDIYNVEAYPDSIKTPLYTIGFWKDSSYHSFAKISFISDGYRIAANGSLPLRFSVSITDQYRAYLTQKPNIDAAIRIGIFEGQKMIREIALLFTLQQLLKTHITSATIRPDLPKGKYFLRFGIASDSGLFTHNSEKMELVVE